MAQPLVVVGSLNMDIVCRVARAPAAGETVLGGDARYLAGGKGANQAVACARLGGSVRMIGRVGSDAFGARLRAGLAQEGIDVSAVGTEDTASGIALILVEGDGQNRITVAPGANARLTPAHVDAAAITWPRGGWLLIQLETPLDTVGAAILAAQRAGLRVMLNPAPAQPLPQHWLPLIDVLVPNESEAALLAGTPRDGEAGALAAARQLRAQGARCVLVTLGERGVLIVDDDGERSVVPPPVSAVDTTAAGDTFTGALAVALSEGMPLRAAAEFAVRAAALSVTRAGAQSSIPWRAELGTGAAPE
ncbi:MAG: ribokinase [Steroidobacteraceae bacterium]